MIVSVNMASMPCRSESAIETVKSLIDQVDIMRIYLNNYIEIPPEFIHDKITIISDGEDLKALGKLFWCSNPDEYYFCVDDDLIYPPSYVNDMIIKLNEYGDDVIISHHGKIFNTKVNSYFKGSTGNYAFCNNVDRDMKVHVIGNGVSLFNTNKIKIDISKFKYDYMDDIEVSIQVHNQGKDAIVVGHKYGYIKEVRSKGVTLYNTYINNDNNQTNMVNSIEWRPIY